MLVNTTKAGFPNQTFAVMTSVAVPLRRTKSAGMHADKNRFGSTIAKATKPAHIDVIARFTWAASWLHTLLELLFA